MFADRLLEIVWAQGSRRGWMTLTSLGLQALAAAFLLLLPLMGTTALPQLRPLSPPVSVALSLLRPQQRTGRGRDANHGELFSLRKLERERSFVTPIFKARIMRE